MVFQHTKLWFSDKEHTTLRLHKSLDQTWATQTLRAFQFASCKAVGRMPVLARDDDDDDDDDDDPSLSLMCRHHWVRGSKDGH